jgi:hypothetical protein
VRDADDDLIEEKLFKYKYRQMADDAQTFERRDQRVRQRFMERAKHRDPALEQDLNDLFMADQRDYSIATLVNDPKNFRAVARDETRPFREYMLNESVQQYKDYYESDAEEQTFFEYLDQLPNRDRIRFMELFNDYTLDKSDGKFYTMIQKREYNPELSAVQNMILDLVDFKDRVRPLCRDISLVEETYKYQKESVEEIERAESQFNELLHDINSDKIDLDMLGLSDRSEGQTTAIESSDVETSALEEESTIRDETMHAQAEEEAHESVEEVEEVAEVSEEPVEETAEQEKKE